MYNDLLNTAEQYEQNIVYSVCSDYNFVSEYGVYYGESSDTENTTIQSPLGSLCTIENNKEVYKFYNTLTRVDIDYYYNEEEETLIQFAHIVGKNINSYITATYREEGLCDVVETNLGQH